MKKLTSSIHSWSLLLAIIVLVSFARCSSDKSNHSMNQSTIDSLRKQILDLTSNNKMIANHLSTFDTLDFTVFSNQDWGRLHESQLKGNLTIHGVTKPVELDATLNGWAVTMTKKNTAGFTIKGKLHRSDFNLGSSPSLTGVSDDITVWANVEIGKN